MKKILFAISILSIAVLVASTLFYFWGEIEFSTNKSLLLVGTIGWFATTPFWIKK